MIMFMSCAFVHSLPLIVWLSRALDGHCTTFATANVTSIHLLFGAFSSFLPLSCFFSRMHTYIRTICILLSTLPIHSFTHSFIYYPRIVVAFIFNSTNLVQVFWFINFSPIRYLILRYSSNHIYILEVR